MKLLLSGQTRRFSWPLMWLVFCCGAAAIFFAVVNPVELGVHIPTNSLDFEINALADTYLVESANMSIHKGYYFNPAGAEPGYLLYKLSAPYPFRYGLLDLQGWNNGACVISTSRDGQEFVPVLSDPPPTGFKTRLRLGETIRGSSEIYLRIDVSADPDRGQTNVYALDGTFILENPVSLKRILIGLGVGLAVAAGWGLYSLLLSRLTRHPLAAVARTDIWAHVPALVLLLYLPLKDQVVANLGGALLFYAMLGVVMVRLYHLIRLIPHVEWSGRLAGAITLIALLVSVLVFYRGIVADGDGIVYYSFARSLLIDGDLDFENEFSYANNVVGIGMVPDRFPQTGLLRYPYPIGTGISQLPFTGIGHLVALLLNHLGLDVLLDGYSLPYVISVAAGSVLYAFAGFCLLLRVLWGRYGPVIAMLSTLSMWFSTTVLSMVYLHPSHSHGPDLLVTVICFSVWYAHRNRTDWKSWVLRGAVTGLCMWVRSQNVVMITLLGYDAIITWLQVRKASPNLQDSLRYIFTVTTGTILGWTVAHLPQIIYNLFTCGCIYYTGVEGISIAWLSPQIGTVLFGGEHGLFYWTPIMVPAVIGLGFLFREDRRLAGGLMLIFAMTVYEVGAFGYFGGAGAGQRYLINMTFPAAFGLAALMAYLCRRISLGWLAAACGAFIVLNVNLLSAYSLGIIPEYGRGVIASEFAWAVLVEGPTRVIEFLDNITYFNKPAFAVGPTLFRFFSGGNPSVLDFAGAVLALGLIGGVGTLIVLKLAQPLTVLGTTPTSRDTGQ